jgi:hypothetical protein
MDAPAFIPKNYAMTDHSLSVTQTARKNNPAQNMQVRTKNMDSDQTKPRITEDPFIKQLTFIEY